MSTQYLTPGTAVGAGKRARSASGSSEGSQGPPDPKKGRVEEEHGFTWNPKCERCKSLNIKVRKVLSNGFFWHGGQCHTTSEELLKANVNI
jgi:hypothetical protein